MSPSHHGSHHGGAARRGFHSTIPRTSGRRRQSAACGGPRTSTAGLVSTFDARVPAPENPVHECITHLDCAGDAPDPLRTPNLLRLSSTNVSPREYRHDHMGGDERYQEPRVDLASGHLSSLTRSASPMVPSPISHLSIPERYTAACGPPRTPGQVGHPGTLDKKARGNGDSIW